ncbi:nitric oxide reductase activation protein NorD [Bdellovibrio svalbardensis]|uniref:VWA domain-containing protein n=1 Tax=Bdellovibrio svalbardensis TaxID=2972972 RepID=A0ABT6DLZ0_9BACT|nr:VWA domain-containing protein [Bdellovibrio svalbardensis]MDG0816934.1 VWA domain-containing protein [Bdellovibrio svalbardensis]
MSFDEALFAFGHRLFKKFTAEPKPVYYDQRAELSELESRLQFIAKSLCGKSIQILEAETMGGFSGEHFYYPKSLCLFNSKSMNESIYIQRTLFNSSAKHLGFSLPVAGLSKIEREVYTCLALYQIYQYIHHEFSSAAQVLEVLGKQIRTELQILLKQDRNTQNGLIAEWIDQILSGNVSSPWQNILNCDHKSQVDFWSFAEAVYKTHVAPLPVGRALPEQAFVLWGVLMAPGTLQNSIENGEDPLSAEALANGTEIQGKNREEVVTVQLAKAGDESNPVMHTFEKVETLEEYQGGMRTQDGDDHLADHAEALEELKLREVVRSQERTNSIYKADIRINAGIPDMLSRNLSDSDSSQVFLYPEWDFKTKSYRKDWCRIEAWNRKSEVPPFQLQDSYAKEKRDMQKLFEQVRHQPLWKKRQKDGTELDLDSLVVRHADLKSGNSSEDRFYMRKQKGLKEWQCLLLIDSSLSTDSWVANERVLDVIKNSVCLIADALIQEERCVSVAAFHSNTRHHCVYDEMKSFQHSWHHLKQHLNDLEPEGYTRIGPALRHGVELLQESSARHKIIILLSDGKASDYDQYEGRYGMEDIKQALREAQQQKVQVKCLAIDEKAKFYLPQMFGAANIQILPNPHKLPEALTSLLLPLL